MAYYQDLREHIKALEANGKLVRIKREINKDTELHPLVRWQYRGLDEPQRKAFLFENVVDVKGKKYGIPVLIANHAASRDVYAIGLMCESDKIMEKWAQAQLHPFKPKLVADGPVHEEVHMGSGLLEHGGLEELPICIATPGFDNAPYFTAANWVTKDPETGITNIGVYRGQIKSKDRVGMMCGAQQDLRQHWQRAKRMGKPLQAAIVIGAVPAIGYVGVTKFPLDVDEYAVAGGIAGEPIGVVKCKTVDLEVPATAEIVIEGVLPTDEMETEGQFGEFTGYMGLAQVNANPYFKVTAITHRKHPIYNDFVSQFTPSEASKFYGIGAEATVYKFLRYDCGLPVLDVALHEGSGSTPYCVIKMKKSHPAQSWQVLNGCIAFSPKRKFIIAVDEDIDPRDADSVNWAMSWRVQPERDVRIVNGMVASLDPSTAPPGTPYQPYPGVHGGSALLIDATRKWDYPPVSLPGKEFMERAKKIWEEEGLPKLNPKQPWHGYSLGYWTNENEEDAQLALKGEHYRTGEKFAKGRIKC